MTPETPDGDTPDQEPKDDPTVRSRSARPAFFVGGKPFPTLEQFLEMMRRLTGREPTEAEIEEARKARAEVVAKLTAEGHDVT